MKFNYRKWVIWALALSLSLVSACTSSDGAVRMDWIRQFGSADGGDDFASAVYGGSGTYVVGYTTGIFPGQQKAGMQDAFISQYDAQGKDLWTHQFGTSLDAYAKAVYVDSDGVYVAGYTNGVFAGQTNAGLVDAFLSKFDANGALTWTRQLGSDSNDYAYAVSGYSGEIYILGVTYGELPGQTALGGSDVFLCKFDPNGNRVWIRQFGSLLNDYAYSVCADASGVYVAGITYGSLSPLCGLGGSDAFVCKYDTSGNELWTQQFGSAGYDYANAIAADSGGVYILGITYGTMAGVKNTGGTDVFLTKITSGGEFAWTRQFGTATTDFAWAITIQSGNIYLAGYTAGTFPGQINAGAYDAYAAAYDADGNMLWIKQFGTDKDDYAKGIFANSAGVYVAGSTKGAFTARKSSSASDAFIAKLITK